MPSKVTKDFSCDNCGIEYMVTFDEDNVIDQPEYCPFCKAKSSDFDETELELDELDFDDE
jgi:hypothetical protein